MIWYLVFNGTEISIRQGDVLHYSEVKDGYHWNTFYSLEDALLAEQKIIDVLRGK